MANTSPIVQANFFGAAPTYSGVCLPTNKRPIINEGEYLGLMNMRMMKSIRKIGVDQLDHEKILFKDDQHPGQEHEKIKDSCRCPYFPFV